MFRVSTMWHFIIDTQPIGSKRQSHLRLLQLLRSAADQVSGWLDDDKVSRQVDPQGQGGGWHQDSEDSGSEQVFYEGPVAGRESYRYYSIITNQRCSNLWSKAGCFKFESEFKKFSVLHSFEFPHLLDLGESRLESKIEWSFYTEN